jgi:hypothetical protein
MPCFFAGVFFVYSKSGNTLKCTIKDDEGILRSLDIIHWYPGKDAGKPFAALAESFLPNSAYHITGDLIIMQDNTLYVPPSYFLY